jgi:hypothetical protein
MPGYLIQQGATVSCVHQGQAQPTAPFPKVLLSDQAVVTQTAPFTVSGCPFMSGSNPLPCVTAQWTTGATRVLAGGAPVLLLDSQAVCAPNGTGVIVSVTQIRVKGI